MQSVGEDELKQTGLVVLVDRLAAAFVSSVRIGDRAMGCVLACRHTGGTHANAALARVHANGR